jgi:hypothetical protein
MIEKRPCASVTPVKRCEGDAATMVAPAIGACVVASTTVPLREPYTPPAAKAAGIEPKLIAIASIAATMCRMPRERPRRPSETAEAPFLVVKPRAKEQSSRKRETFGNAGTFSGLDARKKRTPLALCQPRLFFEISSGNELSAGDVGVGPLRRIRLKPLAES